LACEPEHYWLEFDGLLRVFLSRFGDAESLKKALSKIKSDNDTLIELGEKISNEYLTGTAPAQDEMVQRAIVFDFLLHYGMMYREWLSRNEKKVNQIEKLPVDQAEKKTKTTIKGHLKKFDLKVSGR